MRANNDSEAGGRKSEAGGRRFILPLFSAALLALSYPKFDIEALAWFAFVPFFFALKDKSKFETFAIGYLFGLVFFGLTIYWLTYVSFLGYIILILYLASYFGLFAILVHYPLPTIRYPPVSIFVIPLIWVFLEYVRTYLFTGFGWALLGYSQYLNLPIIQIADKTGVWGVSFIVMMTNVTIFILLKNGIKKARTPVLITIIILGLSLLYGYKRLGEEFPSKSLTISVVQGNIPQHKKWDARFKDEIINTYTSLTREAAKEHPQLIIWPETSLPGYLEEEDIGAWIRDLARQVDTHMLIGAPTFDDESDSYYNSAVLISERGDIVKRYNKLRLVPFGEYVPFEDSFPFIRGLIDKPIGEYKAGKGHVVFDVKDAAKFGVLICFEDIFPGLVRGFVKRGARFMVNITNDAWFMESSAPYQHAQASVFRAVENRIPVVRAANTGLSCFIDSRGRIVDRVQFGEKDIFVSGFKTSSIKIKL